MTESVVEITFSPATLFRLYLNGRGISNKWVANCIDISPEYMSQLLNEKVPLSNKIRGKLNDLLETDY